jgi:hypothetical protein
MDPIKENNLAKRDLLVADSIEYLRNNSQLGYSYFVTSLPDLEEVGLDLPNYEIFLDKAVRTIIGAIEDSGNENGIAIFYQTDRKYRGSIIDKKYAISRIFYEYDYRLILSKIVLKAEPGTINLFRPNYSNLFGFSRKSNSGKATPDVIYSGELVYPNATGKNAAKTAIEFVKSKDPNAIIVDPFCGQGTILRAANDLGLDSFGIDIDPKQIDRCLIL